MGTAFDLLSLEEMRHGPGCRRKEMMQWLPVNSPLTSTTGCCRTKGADLAAASQDQDDGADDVILVLTSIFTPINHAKDDGSEAAGIHPGAHVLPRPSRRRRHGGCRRAALCALDSRGEHRPR
jgi:hypothetical protein